MNELQRLVETPRFNGLVAFYQRAARPDARFDGHRLSEDYRLNFEHTLDLLLELRALVSPEPLMVQPSALADEMGERYWNPQDIPEYMRRLLMAAAVGNGRISYHWLCDVYRSGRQEATRAPSEHTCHDMNPPHPYPCAACEREKAEASRAPSEEK